MCTIETWRSQQLQEAKGRLQAKVQELTETQMNVPPQDQDNISLPANKEQKPDDPSGTHTPPASNLPATLGDALGNGPTGELPDLPNALNVDNTLIQSIKDGYPDDPMFRLVLAKPEQHAKALTI